MHALFKKIIRFSYLPLALDLLNALDGLIEKNTSFNRSQRSIFWIIRLGYVPWLLVRMIFRTSRNPTVAALIFAGAFGTPFTALLPVIVGDQLATGGLACDPFIYDEWDQEYGKLAYDGFFLRVPEDSNGGLLRWKQEIPLNSSIKVTAVPMSDTQANIVIEMHDLYELVIGDGDYRGVRLKTAKRVGEKMTPQPAVTGESRVIFPMAAGEEIMVILDQKVSLVSDGTYNLHLEIAKAAYEAGGLAHPKVFAVYNFPLPPEYKYHADSAWFSFGLDAASDKTEVAAQVMCVEIK